MSKKLRKTFQNKKNKRTAKLKKKRSKSFMMLLKVFVLVVTIWIIFYFIYNSYLFKVTNITVRGNICVSEGEILKSARAQKKANYFDFPSKDIEVRVEKINWIEKASIKKSFPGKVIINVKERTPFVYIYYKDKYYLVDINGYIICDEVKKDGDYPVIESEFEEEIKSGKRIVNDNFTNLVKAYRGLSKDLRKEVKSIESPSEDELTFLINEVEVIYGRAEETKLKNDLIKKFLEERRKERISIIDLRVPKKPIIRVLGK